jgi:hypothetical protein
MDMTKLAKPKLGGFVRIALGCFKPNLELHVKEKTIDSKVPNINHTQRYYSEEDFDGSENRVGWFGTTFDTSRSTLGDFSQVLFR